MAETQTNAPRIGGRRPPKTGFGNDTTTTLSTRACRAVLEKIGLTEEMFFEMYREAVLDYATQRSAFATVGKSALARALQERDREIAELRKMLEEATAPRG